MRKTVRWTLPAIVVLLVGIQFVPVERSNPPVQSEVEAPEPVRSILRRACYDCHSNETNWPWYSHVAPASWLLVRHVNHGRSDLNFSEWPLYDFEEQDWSLNDIHKQIEEGKMPLKSYLFLHPEARLSDSDRRLLLEWSSR